MIGLGASDSVRATPGRRFRLLALLFLASVAGWTGALSGVAHAQGVVGYEEPAATGSISGGTSGDIVASCSAGNAVLSGGFNVQNTDLVVASLPTATNDGWDVTVLNNGRSTTSVTVTAICVSASVAGYEQQTNSMQVPSGGFSDVNVACSSGNKVVGGGFNLGDATLVKLFESDPSLSATITDHNWNLFVNNTDALGPRTVEVAAICVAGSVSGYEEPSNIQNIPAGSASTVPQTCSAGNEIAGGSFLIGTPSTEKVTGAEPTAGGLVDSHTWTDEVTNNDPSNTGLVQVVAICVAPAPMVAFIGPPSGPKSGGTSVTITGTDLTGATAVKFGATDATAFTVDSATQITATAPAGTGTVDITVTTPGGTSATGAADLFTYIPAPTITKVSPSSGPEAGGTSVTITGTGFNTASAVRFGAADAGDFSVVSDTQITAFSPAGTGTVDITVTGTGGTSATGAADQFTFIPPPAITSVSPSQGPETGGTSVTITGTNFTGATSVLFSDFSAASFTVDSDTEITAISPAATGTVDINVSTPNGSSAFTAADQFTYVPAPTVTNVSPTSGPAAGGTSVTIAGTNLTGATAVTFGGSDATSFSVDSATQITATAPAGTGTVDITVTTPGGTSATGAADQFTYIPAPTVTQISPSSGPGAGGTSVTITGTGFTGASAVTFGGSDATSFSVDSATQITATAPAGTGTVDVTVTAPGGTSLTGAADRFTYIPPPAITNVSPSSGPEAGGTSVTITGTDFTGATAVLFGANPATVFTVDSATQITATAPAGTGTVDISVTTADGASALGAADRFTYVPAPTVTKVSPSSGPEAGGTSVTITGTGFTGASAVTFGGSDATSFSVDSASQITAIAPAGSGTVDVTVTAPGGTSATGAADRFTYIPAPTVTSLSPSLGPQAGGTSVTITGTGFTGATAVTFGTIAASSFTVDSATKITAVSPAGIGAVDVTVTTPTGGTSATGSADQFTYNGAPTVTNVSPSSGPAAGGTSVTITGTNFTGASSVTFGTTDASTFTVTSATKITATAPAGTGTVDITITTPAGGSSATGAADRFTYIPAPTVTNVSPASGPEAGGTSVTITGTDFTGASAVDFGATAAASFTVDSATKITVVSPAGTGTVDVIVTTPGGRSATSVADKYVYTPPQSDRTITAAGVSPFSGAAPLAVNGTVAGFTEPDPTASAGAFSAMIDWGDGSAQDAGTITGSSGKGSFAVAGSHTYASPGAFTITVRITETAQPANAATVSDQASATGSGPTVTTGRPSVGSSTGAAFSGSVDPEGLATVVHFEYKLDSSLGGPAGTTSYDQSTPTQQAGSDFSVHQISTSVSGLVPHALYHVRLVASNSAGSSFGPDQTFMTLKDPAPPAPVLGREVNLSLISGLVLIKFPGSHGAADHIHSNALTKGQGFIPLTEARQLPTGTEVDARRGTLKLTTATAKRGKTQSGVFSTGLFKLTQQRHGLSKGLTTLSLLENAFPGAPTYTTCKAHAATAATATAAGPTATTARLSRSILNTLHARDNHGSFRTKGRYSAGTVRGTQWDTTDRCDGTLTTVHRGTVAVRDFTHRKTIIVHAHHHYLAKAIKNRRHK